MRKLFVATILVACSAAFVSAQDTSKFEVFGGFSINSWDTGFQNTRFTDASNRETGLGFETSVTGFFSKGLGVEGDFDGHFKSKTFAFQVGPLAPVILIDTKLRSYNFMAGPHFRFASSSNITPFVHALFGGNHSSLSNASPITGPGAGTSDTDFAMKFGGGVDFGVSKHLGVRVAGDYNPIFQKSDDSLNPNFGNSRTRNDAVFSVGIVFK